MNWLLISILKGSPGDLLIRRGVERLIRGVDPDAKFDVLAKNDPATWTPRPFDRAVVCGMPLFWNEEFTQSDTMAWWKLFSDWPAANPRNIMALGVGSCCSSLARAQAAKPYIEHVKSRMWRVVLRDNYIKAAGVEHLCCPAVFALDEAPLGRDRIVNLMPNGSGWEEFNMAEASAWRRRYDDLIRIFSKAGWVLVSHSQEMLDHALASGWPAPWTYLADTLDGMVAVYSNCAYYFGNRVHGAVAAISAGGTAWNVGYDSRRFTVDAVGGMSCLPSEMNLGEVEDYAALRIVPRHPSKGFCRDEAWSRCVEILSEFAA